MTLQVALLGSDGILLASDTARDASGNKVFGRFLNHKPFVFDARISQKALSGWASRGRSGKAILRDVCAINKGLTDREMAPNGVPGWASSATVQ